MSDVVAEIFRPMWYLYSMTWLCEADPRLILCRRQSCCTIQAAALDLRPTRTPYRSADDGAHDAYDVLASCCSTAWQALCCVTNVRMKPPTLLRTLFEVVLLHRASVQRPRTERPEPGDLGFGSHRMATTSAALFAFPGIAALERAERRRAGRC